MVIGVASEVSRSNLTLVVLVILPDTILTSGEERSALVPNTRNALEVSNRVVGKVKSFIV